jgi:hypothetical protein
VNWIHLAEDSNSDFVTHTYSDLVVQVQMGAVVFLLKISVVFVDMTESRRSVTLRKLQGLSKNLW